MRSEVDIATMALIEEAREAGISRRLYRDFGTRYLTNFFDDGYTLNSCSMLIPKFHTAMGN